MQIAADLNHKHKLRLDLNGKWTPHDERAFFERLPASSIDYIEEPSKDNLTYLKNRFLVAQDESCKNLASLSKVYDYFIYKPTIRGGYANFQKFINKNQKVVFSSAFESEIGLMQIAALSVRCANKFPLGLGTFCYNLTKIAPFKVVNGKLKVDSAIEPHKNIKLTQVFSSH